MDFEYEGTLYDDTARRQQLQDSAYNGIDYLEVDVTPGETNQRVLRVYFIAPGPLAPANKVTKMLDDLDDKPDAFTIEGGSRERNIRVLEAQRVENHIELLVDRPGDFSDYRLTITYDGSGGVDNFPLDLFYREVEFNFKAGCPARFDCRQPLICPPELEAELFVDYMAKDYASFRQVMIDLLPKLIPNWTERRAADIGMTLLELLAYTGDQLSYYQDAVANEAYLATARQRISVRRHAQLIDYTLHNGLSARTLIHLRMAAGGMSLAALPDEDRIIRIMTQPAGLRLPFGIPTEREEDALAATDTVFEIRLRRADPSAERPADALHFHHELNLLPLYNWRTQAAYLPVGATNADLLGDYKYDLSVPDRSDLWWLKPGDLLLFEEVVDPYSGETLLADPNRRHVVRLTGVEILTDNLGSAITGEPVTVTRIHWDELDALPFRLWISNVTADGVELPEISVARGNLAIADYGRTFEEWYPRPPEPGRDQGGIRLGKRALRFHLQESPLAHNIPLSAVAGQPAANLRQMDPRAADPAIHRLDSITKDASGAERRRFWQTVTPSLLNSDRFAEDVVVETDNIGQAHLRFGNNEYGSMPDENSFFQIAYRVGIGPQGNIGADKLTYIVKHDDIGAMANIASLRNPLPAWGGTPPESMQEVKELAPAAFRATLKRAVTEDDYARVMEMHPQVERAVARFRWTGSWHTVFIRVDPKGITSLTDELRRELVGWANLFGMTGYDFEIIDPTYIPLEIELEICVEPGYFTGDIEQDVLEVLSSRRLPDGRVGFFHPDNFTFGQTLYISRIYAAVEEVAGVQSVTIKRIHRQYAPYRDEETLANLERGYIHVGEFAVIRLDNSPNFPENGILYLTMLGGTT